jgi:hypothetical protein
MLFAGVRLGSRVSREPRQPQAFSAPFTGMPPWSGFMPRSADPIPMINSSSVELGQDGKHHGPFG